MPDSLPPPPEVPLPPQLDLPLLHRVYRMSGVLGGLGSLFIMERFGGAAALGFLSGVALSLLLFMVIEWLVTRQMIGSKGSIAAFTFLKLPVLFLIVGLMWLAA